MLVIPDICFVCFLEIQLPKHAKASLFLKSQNSHFDGSLYKKN